MTTSTHTTAGAVANGVSARPAVLVAHSGKQHAYRHSLAVQRCGRLAKFITSGYYKPEAFPDSLAAKVPRLDRPLRRRRLEGLDSTRVTRRWGLELPELIARRVLGIGATEEHLVFRRDEKFDRWVARRWAGNPRAAFDLFWGFQGSCLESLRAARETGRIAVCEFATAHVTAAIRILAAEAERHPEWADSISNLRFPPWYQQRLEAEPTAADICIAASSFTRDSLREVGVDDSRIRLLPLGADLGDFSPAERTPDGPFRILFVGGIGQRKGIKYLLEAHRQIKSPSIELVLVGPVVGSGAGLKDYAGEFNCLGRIDQPAVVREMHRAHVLVLPSVFEGFGLVIAEAMATGLPVIASTHSAGPEIIREGVDGYVLAPDDVAGLAAKLEYLASHREATCEMGRAAAERAREYSWDAHAARVAELLESLWAERMR